MRCAFLRLMEHENDPDIDEPYVPPVGNVLGGEADSQPTAEQPTLADTAEGQGVLCFLGAGKALSRNIMMYTMRQYKSICL